MARIDWAYAENWVADVLQSTGYSRSHADAMAWGLVESEAAGIRTHGIVRTLHYVEVLTKRGVNPHAALERVPSTGPGLLLDAKGGYGFLPMRRLTDELCDVAQQDGIAFGGVRNSHHYGSGWLYAARAARRGLISVIMTNASANLAGPAAKRPVLGNNPLSIAAPGPSGRGPVCGDIAMSVVAQGKIRLASRLGSPIPEGWGRDTHGAPTTDPEAAVSAGLLEPIGGHKGFVLAAMIELIAGAMTGSPFGKNSAAHDRAEGGVGHFAIVLDPTQFIDAEVFRSDVEELFRQVRSAADGADEATLPGWPEEERRRDALTHGLRLDPSILDRLATLDARVGRSLRSDAFLSDPAS